MSFDHSDITVEKSSVSPQLHGRLTDQELVFSSNREIKWPLPSSLTVSERVMSSSFEPNRKEGLSVSRQPSCAIVGVATTSC
jgi:hypothetical protein